jgi:hypothetical protein
VALVVWFWRRGWIGGDRTAPDAPEQKSSSIK